MNAVDIRKIEDQLHVQLPATYKDALLGANLKGDPYDDHPEYLDDFEYLLEENRQLLDTLPPPIEHKIHDLWGQWKSFIRYITGAEARESLIREWHQTWNVGRRFQIGSDLGEELYFIVLTESNPSVYCYDFETGESKIIANSIAEWIVEVKRRQQETEDNP